MLAHGTPDELADIPAYLSNVVSGRPMPQTVIDEITHRYGLIGKSPLTALTLEQGRLLSEALGLPVYVGMRNWKPYIADVVKQMRSDGITEAAVLCLAPQNSRTSVGLYRRAAFAEAGDVIRMDFTEGWADHPLLADAFAERLAPVLAEADQLAHTLGSETPATVLFTAHSVPCRTIQIPAEGVAPLRPGQPDPNAPPAPGHLPQALPHTTPSAALSTPGDSSSPAAGSALPTSPSAPPTPPGQWRRSSIDAALDQSKPIPTPDPYPVEAKHTAANIVARTPGLSDDRWCFAFQSQGMAGGPWIGPTVEDTLTALHAAGAKAVVLQTIGFLCDHVEILYDIDIAFREFAENLGMRLLRPPSLNDSPILTEALVDLARRAFARLDQPAAAPSNSIPSARPQSSTQLAPQ
nr:ferrochelatase [Acidipila sp. EB88]